MLTKRNQPRRKDVKGRPARPKFIARRKVCLYCANSSAQIDYKEIGSLRRYISDRGKIEPRRKTGICARHQRAIATAIKRARYLAILPYVARQPERPIPFSAPAREPRPPAPAKDVQQNA